MIKLSTRGNLQYPILLFISSFIRDAETDILSKYLSFNINLIYVPLMSLGEIIFGLIIYLYQSKYLKHKNKFDNKKTYKYMSQIELIIKDRVIETKDSTYKKVILIIIMSYFDYIQFLLSNELIPKFFTSSYSLESRLSGILIILEAFFYRFVLKLPIFKHQVFSLSIIAFCLIIIIILEFIFQDFNIFLSLGEFVFLIITILGIQFFNSHLDLIEKYLFEYDYINPFKALMFEGILCLFYSAIYLIYKNPLPELIEYYNNNSNFFVLILLFVAYIILSGIKNSYRVITNKIFSPMATTLAIYFLNPIYIIICLILKDDFISDGKRNYIYFSINFILAIIISFSACIYNEFIILFFFGLQYETYAQISNRAEIQTLSIELSRTSELSDDSIYN